MREAGSFVPGRRAVKCADPESAVREADAVILPLPVSRDGIRLNAPGMGDDLPRVTELLGLMKPGATVFGGRIPETAREVCRERGLFAVDYFEDEAFQIRNAVPTAEGALYRRAARDGGGVILHGAGVRESGADAGETALCLWSGCDGGGEKSPGSGLGGVGRMRARASGGMEG